MHTDIQDPTIEEALEKQWICYVDYCRCEHAADAAAEP